MLNDVVDHGNVRVIQRGQKLCFSLETRTGCRVTNQLSRHNLDGNRTVELRITSQVDHSHAAPTNHLSYFITPNLSAYKIGTGPCSVKVILINLDKRAEQSIEFLELAYSLSDLILELRVSFHKFIYIRLPALQLRIDKLLHRFFKYTLLIVVRESGH